MAFSCARGKFHLPRFLTQAAPKNAAPAPSSGDELRELAETFQQTVTQLSTLVHQLEHAHQQAMQAEAEKKRFYREVIRSVTLGKLELVDREELPQIGSVMCEISVRDGQQYAAARKAIREVTREAGMPDDRADDLILAAGEIITNAMKHATEGCCQVYRSGDAVLIRVVDRGTGIGTHELPAALLLPGFSTKVSLGMGYKMLLQLCDHVWLSTSPEGTAVQVEKKVAPPLDAGLLPGLLDRMGA